MDGTGAAGTSAAFARGDHVHPTDTSRMAASATGEDIPANSSGGSSIDEALRNIGTTAGQAATDATTALQDLAGKLDKSGGTVNDLLIELGSYNGIDYAVKLWLSSNGKRAFKLYQRNTGSSSYAGVGELLFPALRGTQTVLASTADIPYDLGTPIVIDTASSETVAGETVYYGAATLANRTANIVQVTAATALDELRITFPAATSGKVRDFGLRVEIGTGSAALAAPALVPIAPTGETIKIENNAAEIPALADGTATAKGVTLLYFSENAPGVFVVKGEQVEEVA
jgi:hypothetical protein